MCVCEQGKGEREKEVTNMRRREVKSTVVGGYWNSCYDIIPRSVQSAKLITLKINHAQCLQHYIP